MWKIARLLRTTEFKLSFEVVLASGRTEVAEVAVGPVDVM